MVGLALEGGGVRCAAQAGALCALEELGFAPDMIAGCGAGAWVAALYALGLRGPELLRMIVDIHQAGAWMLRMQGGFFWHRLTGHPPKDGFFSLERTKRLIRWQSMDALLQDARTPLAVLAWDVENAAVQVLASTLPVAPTTLSWSRSGTIAQAVSASMAIPGIYTPTAWRGLRLVGGSSLWPQLDTCLEALGATHTLRLRVLSAGEARGDALAIALSPELSPLEEREGLIVFPLPSQAGILDFAWMEQHYKIGYETIKRSAPAMQQIWRHCKGRLLPFSR